MSSPRIDAAREPRRPAPPEQLNSGTLAGRATAGLDDLLPLAESSGSYASGRTDDDLCWAWPPLPADIEQERAALEQTKTFGASGFGYFLEQATRPQTIGYALLDSPVALAAWMSYPAVRVARTVAATRDRSGR
jgi:hypothetical protein